MNRLRVGHWWIALAISIVSSWSTDAGGTTLTARTTSTVTSNAPSLNALSQTIATPRIAQLFFPPADRKPVLRVIGKGRAAQPADTAQLVFEFSIAESPPDSMETPSPSDGSTSPYKLKQRSGHPKLYKTPVGEPDKQKLKPVLDALKKAGVAEQDVSVKNRESKGSNPFPFPFPSKVTSSGLDLSVKQTKPAQASLNKLVDVVENAAKQLSSLSLNRTGVTYTVEDCRKLEAQVYRSAGEDALNRATAIASAMGAKLNPVPSIAQPIYDLIYPACRSGRPFPFDEKNADFGRNSIPEVVLTREIFVTFTLKRK